MGAIASQITSLTIVYSTVYSGADQRKHQSSASLAFVRGIHRWPVNSPHKWPETRNMFPFDDVIMSLRKEDLLFYLHCACRWLNTVSCIRDHHLRTKGAFSNVLLSLKTRATLVTQGRLTAVSLNKNDGSWEVVKYKGSIWVEGDPFLTRKEMTQKHSQSKFRLHLVFAEIFEILNLSNWGLPNPD